MALLAPELAGARCSMQVGNTSDYRPANAEVVRFLPMEEFSARVDAADVIVCHGGVGSVLHALQRRKIPVVMPRRRHYREHINDHQLQLVEALAAEGRVIPVYEGGDVLPAILAARRGPPARAPWGEPMLVQRVRQAIDALLPRD